MADSLWHEREAEFANDDFGRSIWIGGTGWSLSLVEPHTRDRPKKSDAPAPRHAPGNETW